MEYLNAFLCGGLLCAVGQIILDRTNLTPGDTVVTSGMGGIYPKGLIVGTVKEVMIGGEVSAIITPSVDFMHLEEVAVILGEGAEQ